MFGMFGELGNPSAASAGWQERVNVNEQASRAEWSVGCHDRIEQLPETSAAARRQWKGATGSSRSMALDTFRRQQEGGPPGKALARKAIPADIRSPRAQGRDDRYRRRACGSAWPRPEAAVHEQAGARVSLEGRAPACLCPYAIANAISRPAATATALTMLQAVSLLGICPAQ